MTRVRPVQTTETHPVSSGGWRFTARLTRTHKRQAIDERWSLKLPYTDEVLCTALSERRFLSFLAGLADHLPNANPAEFGVPGGMTVFKPTYRQGKAAAQWVLQKVPAGTHRTGA